MGEPDTDDNQLPGLDAMAGGDLLRGDLEYQRIITAGARKLFGGEEEVKIGRYTVLGKLGAGAMGEVYACHDPGLDRKIAIKWVLGKANSKGHARLRREAQALAKLSHSNVVQIHEIGEDHGRLFIAMELIEGQTLTSWLDVGGRAASDILAMFRPAGRGLAAAHAAGLVHRDLKPDNVLVGNDGTVRVADFGLAFLGERGPEHDQTLPDEANSDERLTATGATMGTVRYMPLEQLHGSTVDARADQFAFCVALYEALWGRPPFVLGTRQERLRALEREDSPRVPPDNEVLFHVIARGLAHSPDERWPSMDALLDALAPVPRGPQVPEQQDDSSSTRPRWLWPVSAGATIVAAGLLAAWVVSREPEPEPCANIEDQLAGVWDEPTRGELALHIEELEASHTDGSSARVFDRLDHWAGAWVPERRAACERLNGPDQSQLQELRAWNVCLTRQLLQAETLVHELSGGGAAALANAVIAADQLGDPTACADELARLGIEPPPPATREAVEGIRDQLDRVRQQRILAVSDTANLIESLEREARDLGYEPLLAEVLGERARVLDEGQPREAARLYDESIDLAEKHRYAQLAAELLIERTELSLHEMQELDSAKTSLRWARGAAERAGLHNETRARLAFARGRLLQYQGELADADAAYLEALGLSGPDSFARPAYLDARADVRSQLDVDEALELRRESLALAQRLFGPWHPFTAKRHYNYGSALMQAGKDGGTERRLAAEIWTESGDDRWEAKGKLLLGHDALQQGELDAAEQLASTAARLLLGALPEGHPEHGEPEQLLALVKGSRGDHEAALTHARAALESFEREADGQGVDPRAQQMRLEVGNHLLSLGRFDDARVQLSALGSAQGDSSSVAIARVRLAEIAVRQGDLEDADAQLRAAERARDHLGGEQVAYELLRSLVDLRRDQLHAEQVADLQRVRAEHPQVQLEAWLDELGVDTNERISLGFSAP